MGLYPPLAVNSIRTDFGDRGCSALSPPRAPPTTGQGRALARQELALEHLTRVIGPARRRNPAPRAGPRPPLTRSPMALPRRHARGACLRHAREGSDDDDQHDERHERAARHPVEQARPVTGQRAPYGLRHPDRGAGGEPRGARAPAKPVGAAGARRGGPGDRHLRGCGRRAPPRGAAAARQAQGIGQDGLGALPRAGGGRGRGAEPGRERVPRATAPGRPVRGVSAAARGARAGG